MSPEDRKLLQDLLREQSRPAPVPYRPAATPGRPTPLALQVLKNHLQHDKKHGHPQKKRIRR